MHRQLERPCCAPKSIAVIGGVSFGTSVVEQSLKMGYAGDIWPVHPTKDDVEGRQGLQVRRRSARRAGRRLHRRQPASHHRDGARSCARTAPAALSASPRGSAKPATDDDDGERLQAELVEAAGAMPVIGPNCYGLINYADGALLWPDQHGGQRLEPGARGAAIITQSSNIACNLTMQMRGLPLAFLMTAGNQAQTGLSEMALGLIEDDRVTALGLHIEGFEFRRRLRAAGGPGA